MASSPSIRKLMRAAETLEELDTLLQLFSTYTNARRHTRVLVQNLYEKRKKELQDGDQTQGRKPSR